jgi:hypothetical protein
VCHMIQWDDYDDDRHPLECRCKLCHVCKNPPWKCVCVRKCPCGKSLEGEKDFMTLCKTCYFALPERKCSCGQSLKGKPAFYTRCYKCYTTRSLNSSKLT